MDEQSFRQMISGERQGVASAVLRGLLNAASWPYGVVARIRNGLFDLGLKKQQTADVPVIAVGNLTTGGTGKTPIVAWIVQQLVQAGASPGIVSRGYRADESGTNDEKRVLEILCPGVPHVQNPDRVAAVKQIVQDHGVSAVVLDDAFQHRRIARDLNILLIDATNPFGYDRLLPRGLLREPVSGLNRADLVLITRTDRVQQAELQKIRDQICAVAPQLKSRISAVRFASTGLVTKSGESCSASQVEGKRVAVLTGIGNPEAFAATCVELGATIAARRFFPDHHHFTKEDVNGVQQMAEQENATHILTTLKDLVKLPDNISNLLAVQIQTTFTDAAAEDLVREEILRVARPPSH